MKLIDTENYKPDSTTFRGRLAIFFIDYLNFCSDYADGTEKPANPIYDFFRKYWLFPFKQTGCACCNSVRSLIYGAIIGYLLGVL